MIKAPNTYSPLRNPERARQRRDLVLKLMREEKKIDDASLAQALARAGRPHFPGSIPHQRAALRGFRQGGARGAFRREAEDRGAADLHDARRGPPARGAGVVTKGLATLEKNYRRLAANAKQEPLQGALIVLEPRTGAVQGLRRGPRLPSLAVQPGHAGAPAARVSLQALRLPGGLRAAGPGETGDARDDPRGLADHRDVGQGGGGPAVDVLTTTTGSTGADVGAQGAGAVDQHPDGPRGARRGIAGRCWRRRGPRGSGPACGPIPRSPSAPSKSRRSRSRRHTPSSPTEACAWSPIAIVGVRRATAACSTARRRALEPACRPTPSSSWTR